MGNKILDITCTDFCYICGSPEKRSGNSLHCWDIEFECGCKIWGALGTNIICLDTDCPNNN